MKKKLIGLATALALSVPIQSMAATYQVFAQANSTSGGVSVDVPVFAGQSFSVSVDPSDLWNAGDLPRWSNANGIDGPDLIATGLADVTGDNPAAASTVIGQDIFGDYAQGGLTAPYGSLVGQFGLDPFFKIGTSYTGTATDNTLKLFYFDVNNGDNTGSILASVTSVPEPETYGMMLVGLGMMSFMVRRRKNAQA
jgi:hypothetical protein